MPSLSFTYPARELTEPAPFSGSVQTILGEYRRVRTIPERQREPQENDENARKRNAGETRLRRPHALAFFNNRYSFVSHSRRVYMN